MPFTFSNAGAFVVATCPRGRTFRVLLAVVRRRGGFFLQPWRINGQVPGYRGRYVWEGRQPELFTSIAAAYARGPGGRLTLGQFRRFAADVI